MNRVLAAVVVLFALTGSLLASSPPKPTTSKYFHSAGGGFFGDGEKHGLFYGVTLEVRSPIPDGAVADFLFENPSNPKEPLLATVVITGSPRTISARSPALPTIENNKIYTFRVILYRDETRKEKLGEHSQKLQFSVPEKMFETTFKTQFFQQH
jgi:hypothetical protein